LKVHTNLQWKDCADTVEMDKYWYDPSSSAFKKLPVAVDQSTAGEIIFDAEDNPTESIRMGLGYDETWSKGQII
jgi:hypothetical protein